MLSKYTSIVLKNKKVYFQSTQVYCRNTHTRLADQKYTLKVQRYSFEVQKYTFKVQKYPFKLHKYTFKVQKYTLEVQKYTLEVQKVYCGEKNPKARLLRVLSDSIDLLALFGVYAGIILISRLFSNYCSIGLEVCAHICHFTRQGNAWDTIQAQCSIDYVVCPTCNQICSPQRMRGSEGL